MFNIKPYPAILEKTKDGFSVFFPDLPGVISVGEDYEHAVLNARESLSLHLYGMLHDHDPIPEPSHISELMDQVDKTHLVALIEPDIFAIKATQEDKAVRINITLPQSLLKIVDMRAKELGINRSMFIQKATREVI